MSATISVRLSSSPVMPSRMLRIRNDTSAVYIAFFIWPYSPAPKWRLTMTEAPTPPPMATQMKIFVSAYDAPTAARADEDTKRPTIAESAIV